MIAHALDVKTSNCTPNPSRNVLLFLLQSQCETMIALADCAKVRLDMSPTRVCHEAIRLFLGMKKSFKTRTTSGKYDFEARLEACVRVMDTTNLLVRVYSSRTMENKQAEALVVSYDEVKRKADGLLERVLDTISVNTRPSQ